MKYAILSDIHANAEQLRRVLADAAAQQIDRVVVLGDVVGYGPQPAEALALVRQTAHVVLAGNHDDAVSARQGAADFIDLAGDAVARHREQLDDADIGWLRTLPYTAEIDGALAAHGDFTDPKAFNYIGTADDARASFAATDARLLFVGHTHVPGIFVTGQSGQVYRLEAQDFALEDGKRYIVNPGSVGYPREENGVCLSTYVIYDSAAQTVAFRRLPFSVASVMQRGKNPRQRKAIALAAVAAAVVAAFCGVVFTKATQRPAAKIVPVEIKETLDCSLVVAAKSVTLTGERRFVRANVKLDRKSAPVHLTIEFKSADGALVDIVRKTVKNSSRDRHKAPEGAISAHFTLLKTAPDQEPNVLSFTPSCSAK